MVFVLTWKGKVLKDLGTFKTEKEAETVRGIEMTQMELAEYSPEELQKFFKIKKISKNKKRKWTKLEKAITGKGIDLNDEEKKFIDFLWSNKTR